MISNQSILIKHWKHCLVYNKHSINVCYYKAPCSWREPLNIVSKICVWKIVTKSNVFFYFIQQIYIKSILCTRCGSTFRVYEINIKNTKSCKGSGILSYLQANELACHSFMDASRGHETTRSNSKESLLVTALAVTRVLAFLHQFLELQFCNMV